MRPLWRNKHLVQRVMATMLAAAVIAAFFAVRLLLGYIGLLRLLTRSETPPPEVRGLFETMAAGMRWVRATRVVPVPGAAQLRAGCGRQSSCHRPCAGSRCRSCGGSSPSESTHLRRPTPGVPLFNFGQIFFFAVPWFWAYAAKCGSVRNLSPTRRPPNKTRATATSNTPSFW